MGNCKDCAYHIRSNGSVGVCGLIHEDSAITGDFPHIAPEDGTETNGGGFDLWTPDTFGCTEFLKRPEDPWEDTQLDIEPMES